MGCTVRTDQPHPSSSLNQKRNPRISTVRHRTQHYGRVHESRTSESSLVVDDLSHLATRLVLRWSEFKIIDSCMHVRYDRTGTTF